MTSGENGRDETLLWFCHLLQVGLPVDQISPNLSGLSSNDVGGDCSVHSTADIHPEICWLQELLQQKSNTTWMETTPSQWLRATEKHGTSGLVMWEHLLATAHVVHMTLTHPINNIKINIELLQGCFWRESTIKGTSDQSHICLLWHKCLNNWHDQITIYCRGLYLTFASGDKEQLAAGKLTNVSKTSLIQCHDGIWRRVVSLNLRSVNNLSLVKQRQCIDINNINRDRDNVTLLAKGAMETVRNTSKGC